MPGFAQIAALLHSLLKKEAHFYWSPESQQAFEQLKQLLTSALFWHINDSILNTLSLFETDASAKGFGTVLAQQQEDDKVHPIAFASGSLNAQERNCGITEMEMLAVVWAARMWDMAVLFT